MKWPGTTLGTNDHCLSISHQDWDNIHTMLPEHCLNISPQHSERYCHNVHTTLPEHCLNIRPKYWTQMLTHEHCLNVSPQHWKWHCHNIHTTLPQCCLNVGQCWPMLWQCCGNVGIWVKIKCWYNIHTKLSGYPHNVTGIFEVSTNERRHNDGIKVGTMLAPTLWQHYHNGGALAGETLTGTKTEPEAGV